MSSKPYAHPWRRAACLSLALPLVFTAALLAQPQTNSPEASLTVNGNTGSRSVRQGTSLTAVMTGAPNKNVLLWFGSSTPSIYTAAGWIDVFPIDGFILNGLSNPAHTTDASGTITWESMIPWYQPLGYSLNTQGAVEDPLNPVGFKITAPSSVTVTAGTFGGDNLFFDPTTGAKGIQNVLPPAGTLPGDLPTLSFGGFPGPTGVMFNGDPVHGVFQNSFTCYSCHGQSDGIWGAYRGTMMANSARDPMFHSLFPIAVASIDYLNQNGLSPIGGELAADYCIRCHSPNAWYSGRSGLKGDGVSTPFEPDIFDHQHSLDMEGIVCDMCHRATDSVESINQARFVVPGQPENTQLVISPEVQTKRGPYPGTNVITFPNGTTSYGAHVPPSSQMTLPSVPHIIGVQEGTAVSPFHDTEQSAFHASSRLCASCHNISNPINGHSVERTYSEWLDSDFGDPSSPDFKTCQDCHMPLDPGNTACSINATNPTYGDFNKIRIHYRKHEFVGGNAWIPQILKQLYPLVDLPWTNGSNYEFSFVSSLNPSRNTEYDQVTARAYAMMKASAHVDLTATEPQPNVIEAQVKITNLTGHKLPTGYPEGRQMWVSVEAEDANGAAFYQVGLLDAQSRLIPHQDLKIYQVEHGLDYPTLGLSGPSFHFVMNNVPYKDNRILAKGMTQRKGKGGTDSYDPVTAPFPVGGLYPDGQHWDTTTFSIPVPVGTARPIKVKTTVFYQTASREYIEFLANGGDSIVSTVPSPQAIQLLQMWDNGFPAPAVPVGVVGPTSTPDPTSPHTNQTAMAIIN